MSDDTGGRGVTLTPEEAKGLRDGIAELRRASDHFVTTRELLGYLLGFAALIVAVVSWAVNMLLTNHVEIVTQKVTEGLAPQFQALSGQIEANASAPDGAATDRLAQRLDAIETRLSEMATTLERIETREDQSQLAPGTEGEEAPQALAGKDIVDTAVEAGGFATLVAAVEAAGLVDTLKGEGPFTIFAPTDDAFADLPEGTVEDLLRPENRDRLMEILTYHVVPGRLMSQDLSDGMQATTVQGSDVSVTVDTRIEVGGADVVRADIPASNGVIHVIDSVILPN